MPLVAFKSIGTNEAMPQMIVYKHFFGRTQVVLQVSAE
jgi:hypothetical protein